MPSAAGLKVLLGPNQAHFTHPGGHFFQGISPAPRPTHHHPQRDRRTLAFRSTLNQAVTRILSTLQFPGVLIEKMLMPDQVNWKERRLDTYFTPRYS